MYKILLPVASPAFLLEQKLKDLKGLEDKLIVVNNWTDPKVELLVKEFSARGAEAYDCKYNLGLAASWNLGLRRMIEDNKDFLVILSASAVFDKDIRYFVETVQNEEAKGKGTRYVSGPRALLHCFAQTRYCVELGGYFDENFWPIYYEDTDYSWRSKHNGVAPLVKGCIADDVVHSYAYSIACTSNQQLMSLHQNNCHRYCEYYVKKWGGNHGTEKYLTPFNDPNLHINDWKIDQPFYHIVLGQPKWQPPKDLKRY